MTRWLHDLGSGSKPFESRKRASLLWSMSSPCSSKIRRARVDTSTVQFLTTERGASLFEKVRESFFSVFLLVSTLYNDGEGHPGCWSRIQLTAWSLRLKLHGEKGDWEKVYFVTTVILRGENGLDLCRWCSLRGVRRRLWRRNGKGSETVRKWAGSLVNRSPIEVGKTEGSASWLESTQARNGSIHSKCEGQFSPLEA